jgi:hypothetical protein
VENQRIKSRDFDILKTFATGSVGRVYYEFLFTLGMSSKAEKHESILCNENPTEKRFTNQKRSRVFYGGKGSFNFG